MIGRVTMVTIKDIAKKAGVSAATVSRVLNYDEKISVNKATQKTIFRIAKELGYQKKKVSPPIDDVALLYWPKNQEELQDVYLQSIQTELIKQADQRNIKLKLYKKSDGLESIEKGINAFFVIGWNNISEINFLKRLSANGIFIGTSPDESCFDSVRPNYDSIVTQIVDYFVKHGYKSLGFMGETDFDIYSGKPLMDVREWSFRESAKYYGMLNEKNIFTTDTLTVKEGYRLALEAIKRLGNEMPSAFCVSSDTLAIGAFQAFHEAGWNIPSRVAFFSIGDLNISKYISPPLTTFHIDIPLMCDAALSLLQERILKNRTITKSVFINGMPVYRKSC